jgi:hypothetical protein
MARNSHAQHGAKVLSQATLLRWNAIVVMSCAVSRPLSTVVPRGIHSLQAQNQFRFASNIAAMDTAKRNLMASL